MDGHRGHVLEIDGVVCMYCMYLAALDATFVDVTYLCKRRRETLGVPKVLRLGAGRWALPNAHAGTGQRSCGDIWYGD